MQVQKLFFTPAGGKKFRVFTKKFAKTVFLRDRHEYFSFPSNSFYFYPIR